MTDNSYTNTDFVQAEIRATTPFDNATFPSLIDVERWILEASREIELRTGQVFSSSTVSSEYHDYNNTGEDIFRFPSTPLISVSTFEYNVHALGAEPSWITLEEGFDKNYILYLDEAEAEFIPGVNSTNKITPKSGKKRFRITWIKGYVNTPLEVQQLCTLITAKRVIMSLVNSQANTEGGEIQVGTIKVSDPSNYSLLFMQNMNSEIDRLYSEIGQKFRTFRGTRVYD